MICKGFKSMFDFKIFVYPIIIQYARTEHTEMGANTVVDFAQIPHSVTISLGNVWMGVNQDISLICVTKVSEINSNVVTHLLSFCHAINFYTKLHEMLLLLILFYIMLIIYNGI